MISDSDIEEILREECCIPLYDVIADDKKITWTNAINAINSLRYIITPETEAYKETDEVIESILKQACGIPDYAVINGNLKIQWNDILSPYVPTLADYTLNTLTPFYNRAAYCNYHQGGYDAIGNLIFPYTVDGVSGGGFMDFTFGDLVKIPIEVPADPQYQAFQQDCTTFYPKSTTFQGFGISGNDGATYERMQQDQERCYAPFYRPEAIVPPGGSEIQNERFRQCFMLGKHK